MNRLEAFLAATDRGEPEERQVPSGYAFFKSEQVEGYVPLSEPTPALAVVAESFHVRPLLPLIQAQQRFHLIAARRQAVDVCSGDRSALSDVQTILAPLPLAEMNPLTTRAWLANVMARLPTWSPGRSELIVVTGAAEFVALVQEFGVSVGAEVGVVGRAAGSEGDVAGLHARAWRVASSMLQRRAQRAIENYELARNRGLGTDSLSAIALASTTGRVRTLIIEEGVHLWGSLCRNSGAIKLATEASDAPVDDILDDLAEMTLATGGSVFVVPTRDMPTSAAACATLKPIRSHRGRRHVVSVADVLARR